MPTKRISKHFGPLIVASLVLNSLPAEAETKPKTECNIRIDNAHISKSLKLRRGFDAVKINAQSNCNLDMSNLSFTIEIYKHGFLRNHRVRERTLLIDGVIPANQKIEHKQTWVKCKNTRPSSYFGIAYASGFVSGKLVRTPRTYTNNSVLLPCGT